mgnify:FL=1
MNHHQLPKDLTQLNPGLMSTNELRETHEFLWELITEKESEENQTDIMISEIEQIRSAVKKILAERVERQMDEGGPRGV